MSDTLMISVSGMRGHVGTYLTPELVARHAAALGAWVRTSALSQVAAAEGGHPRPAVVLGRDARTSGPMFAHAAAAGQQDRRTDTRNGMHDDIYYESQIAVVDPALIRAEQRRKAGLLTLHGVDESDAREVRRLLGR